MVCVCVCVCVWVISLLSLFSSLLLDSIPYLCFPPSPSSDPFFCLFTPFYLFFSFLFSLFSSFRPSFLPSFPFFLCLIHIVSHSFPSLHPLFSVLPSRTGLVKRTIASSLTQTSSLAGEAHSKHGWDNRDIVDFILCFLTSAWYRFPRKVKHHFTISSIWWAIQRRSGGIHCPELGRCHEIFWTSHQWSQTRNVC